MQQILHLLEMCSAKYLHERKQTYGSASNVGNAVPWIFDGALNPIAYTPFNKAGLL